VQAKEIQGGYKWLMFAGGLAVLLSCFLFWVDDVVMQHAPERDKEHAAQMRELRMAQSGLPARVTDDRQTLPLVLEQQDHAMNNPADAHEGEDHHDHGHDHSH
jgi:hypothetical protein